MDPRAIGALSERSECDIRACLNTLQLLSTAKTRGDVVSTGAGFMSSSIDKQVHISLEDVTGRAAGEKDMTMQVGMRNRGLL